MMTKASIKIKSILFLICLILIILFYLWTTLLGITLFLIFIADSLTIKLSFRFLKRKLSSKFFTAIKLGFYIILPLMIAIFIRTFFFDIYYVPSSSMERTLFPKDYVLVNKVKYGTKVPKQMRNIPIIGSFFKTKISELEYDLYKPLHAFNTFKREDIVVFKSTIDQNKFLIKRIIGKPGDTIKSIQSKVLINNKPLIERKEYTYNYSPQKKNSYFTEIKNYSYEELSQLSDSLKKTLRKDINEGTTSNSKIFDNLKWSRDEFGSIIIPKKGMTLSIDTTNIAVYHDIIEKFEGKSIFLGKEAVINYTFEKNYFFMMGDNRHSSFDSRYFGLVPEEYILGKMIGVYSKKRLFKD